MFFFERKPCGYCNGTGKCLNWRNGYCYASGCQYKVGAGGCKIGGRCPACGGKGWV